MLLLVWIVNAALEHSILRRCLHIICRHLLLYLGVTIINLRRRLNLSETAKVLELLVMYYLAMVWNVLLRDRCRRRTPVERLAS